MSFFLMAAKRRGGAATSSANSFDGYAELPRVTPSWEGNTFLAYSGGTEHTPVNASALNTLLTGGTLARGDRITLTAGVNYNTGVNTQRFPVVSGSVISTDPSTFIHVRSSAVGSLPAFGQRVDDGDTTNMPLFQQQASGGSPAIAVASGASGYVFSGIQFTGGSVTSTSRLFEVGPAFSPIENGTAQSGTTTTIVLRAGASSSDSAYNGNWIKLITGTASGQHRQIISYVGATRTATVAAWTGASPDSTTVYAILDVEPVTASLADWIILDRCHGSSTFTNTSKRCVLLHTKTSIVEGCSLFNQAHNDPDDQAIGGWNTAGPVLIKNNYLVGGAQSILWGGAPRYLTDSVAVTDGTIIRNYMYKPPTWDGVYTSAKLIYENKHGIRFLVEGNVMEGFRIGQQAYAINLKSDADITGEVTSDITIRYNSLVDCEAFITARDAIDVSTPCSRITVRDNLVVGVVDTQMGFNAPDSILRNNTVIPNGTPAGTAISLDNLVVGASDPDNVEIYDNIFDRSDFGVKNSGVGEGTASLDFAYGTYVFTGNAIIRGLGGATYPAGNTTPANIAGCGFTNIGTGDYSLSGSSALLGTGRTGGNPGADITTLNTRISGAITGIWP